MLIRILTEQVKQFVPPGIPKPLWAFVSAQQKGCWDKTSAANRKERLNILGEVRMKCFALGCKRKIP